MSLLSKIKNLKREAIAAQPVDPLACLTPDEKDYYKRWWNDFKTRHLDESKPDALYQACLSYTGYQPSDLLPNWPHLKSDLSEEDLSMLWFDICGGGRKLKRVGRR